jgi:hypothetical protein
MKVAGYLNGMTGHIDVAENGKGRRWKQGSHTWKHVWNRACGKCRDLSEDMKRPKGGFY